MTDQAITVNTALLKQKLKLVAPYAPAKSPLPITSHILLVTERGGLALRATDLDQSVCLRIPLDGQPEGFAACLPSKEFKKLVDSLKAPDVLLTEDGKYGAVIRAGGHTSSLRGIDPAHFPTILRLEQDDELVCSLQPTALKNLADRTAGAASKEDTRPVLRGVLLEQTGGTLTATATDGFRLSSAEEKVKGWEDAKLLVPAKALKTAALAVLSSTCGAHIYYNRERSHLILTGEGTEVFIRLIAGTYPNWRQIVPSSFKTHVTVEPTDLLEAIKGATAGASIAKYAGKKPSEVEHVVRIEVNQPDSVRVSSTDPDGNEFAVRPDVATTGPAIEVNFNPAYLVEAIKALVGGSTASSTKITATTTVTPSRTATAAPIPSPVVSTDPVVLASLVASAQIRLSAVETRYGPGTPQYDAANQRLVAARTARKARLSGPAATVRPDVAIARKPDPVAASVPASGSKIELCFTGPSSACLVRNADGSGDQTHVIMPMKPAVTAEPVPGRSGLSGEQPDVSEQAA